MQPVDLLQKQKKKKKKKKKRKKKKKEKRMMSSKRSTCLSQNVWCYRQSNTGEKEY